MLPNLRAPAGQTSRHAGYRPWPRALDAEVAFLHHALAARTIAEIGHLRVEPLLRNLRLRQVESPRPIRTGGFAIAAADAPVVINHRDAVRFLPGGVDGTDLHARRVLALLALHRHVEETLLRHLLRIVIVLGLLDVERTVRHFQHADVLNLRVARLVVFRDAGVDAFAAADAAREVQAINELHAVHRLVKSRTCGRNAVLLFDLVLDALEDLRHVRRRHLLVILLHEPLGGREILHFHQRLETRRQRRQAGGQHRRRAQKAAPVHADSAGAGL